MPVKNVNCPYCNYAFMADANKPTTFCPSCKKTVLTTPTKQGLLSRVKTLPKNVKYIIIAALIIGIVYIFLNMFDIV